MTPRISFQVAQQSFQMPDVFAIMVAHVGNALDVSPNRYPIIFTKKQQSFLWKFKSKQKFLFLFVFCIINEVQLAPRITNLFYIIWDDIKISFFLFIIVISFLDTKYIIKSLRSLKESLCHEFLSKELSVQETGKLTFLRNIKICHF